MRIASWNVNGIRARAQALEGWVRQNEPDILVLQEIKADEADIPSEIRSLDAYRMFWNGSTFRKGYSGTGILIRESDLLRDASFEIPAFDVENRTCVLHTGNLSLIGTYIPRGDAMEHYRIKLQFLAAVRAYAEDLLVSGRQVVLLGDMNVAHRDADVHHSQNRPGAVGLRLEEREAISALMALGLHDVMRERNPERHDLFTWWPYWRGARERNIGWRIDCCYLSLHLLSMVTCDRVDLAPSGSDHAPILIDLQLG